MSIYVGPYKLLSILDVLVVGNGFRFQPLKLAVPRSLEVKA